MASRPDSAATTLAWAASASGSVSVRSSARYVMVQSIPFFPGGAYLGSRKSSSTARSRSKGSAAARNAAR